MTGRSVKFPGPDHPITIESASARLIVSAGDKVIADTRRTLILREASYPPVHYVPREDVDMTLLTPSARTTWCPYKGDCRYFGIQGGGVRAVDAAWSYETPHAAVAAIKEHLAFYPDRVSSIEERREG